MVVVSNRKNLFRSIFFYLLALSIFLLSNISFAQTAPQYLNLQAVLVDNGGNVLYNKQEADITFQIIDGAGAVLYEEVQMDTPIIKGAISVLVGEGIDPGTGNRTGGIPMAALSPEGTRLIRFKLNDDTIAQEDLQLASVPYAYYAQSSLDVVDGRLQVADLSPDLVEYIRTAGVTREDFASHQTQRNAHTARSVSVENSFIYSAGDNLQSVLENVDNTLNRLFNGLDLLSQQFETEISSIRTSISNTLANHEIRIGILESRDPTRRILAWANIQRYPGGNACNEEPTVRHGSNIARVDRCPASAPSCNSCFKLFFDTNPTSEETYTVTGVLIDQPNSNVVSLVVNSFEDDGFVIQPIDEYGNGTSNQSFSVMVVGY